MDSLTHVVLGACVGEAALSDKLGKKALAVGAVAQSFPDIDGVASLWLSPTESLLFHRGITHSFLFGLLAAVGLTFITQRLFSNRPLPFTHLVVFFALQLWLHDVLDTCNAYGTGLLEPFSDRRFSWGLLFVADPFFTKPTAFNTWLWYIVAPVDSGYYIGYRSVFDRASYVTPFVYYPQNQALLRTVDTSQQVPLENLITFADRTYTVEARSDTLVFNVIRFGRIAGWRDRPTQFTFQYYLNPGFDNALVVQRGRLKEWRWQVFRDMYERIRGK